MNIIRKAILIFASIFFITGYCLSQSTIKGTVVASDSKKPLPGVNVYLSGTSIGASTGQDGNFKLKTSQKGNFNLIVSFVGFKKKVFPIELSDSTSITKKIKLDEKVTELKEIEVKTSNRTWKHRYGIFKEQLLGRTELAERVTIENPWVLNFRENGNLLIAEAKEPLKIVNPVLGYNIHVELVMFKWPKYKDHGGAYKIYPKFEPMNAANPAQEKEWKEARIKSYMGSFHHFLKSLYINKVNTNGFTINNGYYLNTLSKGKTRYEVMQRRNVSESIRETVKGFELEHIIDVEYSAYTDYTIGGEKKSIKVEKEGGIESNIQSSYFFVTNKGALVNPISLKTYGDWAKERVANRLPLNFTVE